MTPVPAARRVVDRGACVPAGGLHAIVADLLARVERLEVQDAAGGAAKGRLRTVDLRLVEQMTSGDAVVCATAHPPTHVTRCVVPSMHD